MPATSMCTSRFHSVVEPGRNRTAGRGCLN
jgi:hypothetical protein